MGRKLSLQNFSLRSNIKGRWLQERKWITYLRSKPPDKSCLYIEKLWSILQFCLLYIFLLFEPSAHAHHAIFESHKLIISASIHDSHHVHRIYAVIERVMIHLRVGSSKSSRIIMLGVMEPQFFSLFYYIFLSYFSLNFCMRTERKILNIRLLSDMVL